MGGGTRHGVGCLGEIYFCTSLHVCCCDTPHQGQCKGMQKLLACSSTHTRASAICKWILFSQMKGCSCDFSMPLITANEPICHNAKPKQFGKSNTHCVWFTFPSFSRPFFVSLIINHFSSKPFLLPYCYSNTVTEILQYHWKPASTCRLNI